MNKAWEPKDGESYWTIKQNQEKGNFCAEKLVRYDIETGHFGAVMTMIYDGGRKVCPVFKRNKINNNVFRTRAQARLALSYLKRFLKDFRDNEILAGMFAKEFGFPLSERVKERIDDK